MAIHYGAICSDYYINQRLNLKMDLPLRRGTVLAMFDRVRRSRPSLCRFRRYDGELALESGQPVSVSAAEDASADREPFRGSLQPQHPRDTFHADLTAAEQEWIAVRRTSVRSGSVNPGSHDAAIALHELVLDAAPYFLDISPLDVDHVELLFGFDLRAAGNHDQIVMDTLLAGSPLAALATTPGAIVVDAQPLVGVALSDACDLQAHMEIKTRTSVQEIRTGDFREEAISVYLTVRKYATFKDVKQLPAVLRELCTRADTLLEERIIPSVILPLRDAIVSGGGGGGGGGGASGGGGGGGGR